MVYSNKPLFFSSHNPMFCFYVYPGYMGIEHFHNWGWHYIYVASIPQLGLHSWPYPYNCIVKKSKSTVCCVKYLRYVLSLYTILQHHHQCKNTICTKHWSVPLYVYVYYKLYTILYLMYSVSITKMNIFAKKVRHCFITQCILIHTRNLQRESRRRWKKGKEKEKERSFFMAWIKYKGETNVDEGRCCIKVKPHNWN